MKRRSWALASATFAAGFGAMNIFYWSQAPTLERGLYTYWSATLGDAVALPILVMGLSEADARLSKTRQVPPRIGVIGGSIGSVAGLVSQLAWLADSDPDPNWTIPAPHTFTDAGLYHATFTVAAAGLIASLAARVAWSMNARRRSNLPTSDVRKPLMLAGVAILAFTSLAVADNWENSSHSASAASLLMLGLGAAGAAGLTAWARRGGSST